MEQIGEGRCGANKFCPQPKVSTRRACEGQVCSVYWRASSMKRDRIGGTKFGSENREFTNCLTHKAGIYGGGSREPGKEEQRPRQTGSRLDQQAGGTAPDCRTARMKLVLQAMV